MRWLTIVAGLLASTAALADDPQVVYKYQPGSFGLFEPTSVYIDYFKYETLHDPYLNPTDERIGSGASFNTNFNILRYGSYRLFMDNNLHFDQDRYSGQIKAAGWQYELGLTVLVIDGKSRVELFRQHHSQHILEDSRDTHFPVYDRVGVRVRIWP